MPLKCRADQRLCTWTFGRSTRVICGVAAAIGWGGLERRVRSEFAQVSETHLLPTAMLWTQALVPELSLAECSKSIGTVSNSSLYEDCLTQELRSERRGGKRSPERGEFKDNAWCCC